MKRGSREVGHAALTFDLIFDPSTTMVVQAARIEMKMRCVALSQNLNIFAPAPPGGNLAEKNRSQRHFSARFLPWSAADCMCQYTTT